MRRSSTKTPSCLPLRESRSVGERCTPGNHGSRRVDVGAGFQERVEDFSVVTAGGPVQWGLPVRLPEAGVHVRFRLYESRDGGRAVRK